MYYGVPHIWQATSIDLIDWEPVEDYAGNLAPVLNPRPGYFDSWLVEAGPPPVLTDDGIVVLYGAGNSSNIGVKDLGDRVTQAARLCLIVRSLGRCWTVARSLIYSPNCLLKNPVSTKTELPLWRV